MYGMIIINCNGSQTTPGYYYYYWSSLKITDTPLLKSKSMKTNNKCFSFHVE